MKSNTNGEKVSEIFDWIFMNVVIVIGIPVAKLIILLVAEETIDVVSLMSDYSLIAFSIAFNVGAYITDKSQRTSYTSTKKLAEDVAEELVRKSSASSASQIVKHFFNILSTVLTDESKENFEKAFEEYTETESKIKTYNKCIYLFAAICLSFFAVLSIINVKNYYLLFLPCLIVTIMLIICICVWASLSKKSKMHSASTINEVPILENVSKPEGTAIDISSPRPVDLVEQNKVSQGEAPQGEAPQGEAPQGEAPQGEAPQGEAPQEEVSQGEAPQEEVPQEEVSQGEAPREKVSQEAVPQDTPPQDAPSEN